MKSSITATAYADDIAADNAAIPDATDAAQYAADAAQYAADAAVATYNATENPYAAAYAAFIDAEGDSK